MTASIKLGTAQIVGAREDQQDSFGLNDKADAGFVEHGGVLAVVADGIGGHAHGGEASRRAVEAFMQEYAAKPRQANIQDALYHALTHANRAVLEFAESQGESENCGTTLVAAALHPGSLTLHWVGVGDSRLYFFRDGEFVQFTADANYGCHLIKKVARGIVNRDALDSEENPNRLTSFLGLKKLVNIDRSIRPFPLHQGDKVLLCTDGVYQAMRKEELAECLLDEPQIACDSIVQSILDKNLEHQDNATVAVLAYGFAESTKADSPRNDTINRVEVAGSLAEPLKMKARLIGKTSLWFWGISGVALLLILLWAVWLRREEDKALEKKKVVEMELPVLQKSAEPHKSSPKR